MSVTLGVGARLPAFCRIDGPRAAVGPGRRRARRLAGAVRAGQAHRRTPCTDLRALRRIVDDVRTQGYAYVEQELELGLCSIAVPVRNGEGRVATAINVSMPYHPMPARGARATSCRSCSSTAAAIEGCAPSHAGCPAVAA